MTGVQTCALPILKVLNAAETDKQELGLLMAGIGAAEKSPADGEAEE